MQAAIVSLVLLALPAPAPLPGPSVYLVPGLYLVRARTVEVARREVAGPPPRATIPEGRFEVLKVYLGPDWLKQYTFTCDQVPYQITVTSPLDRLHVQVGLKKGVEGLWWVTYDPAGNGNLRPVLQAGTVDGLGIRPFPYQQTEASFPEGLAWAEAVEKVYRAGSDRERGRLLRGYAAEVSVRGAWAIASLARSGDADLAGFFRALLADEKLPLASQVALDGALAAVDAKGWEGSKERAALYARWREAYPGPLLPLPLEVMDAALPPATGAAAILAWWHRPVPTLKPKEQPCTVRSCL